MGQKGVPFMDESASEQPRRTGNDEIGKLLGQRLSRYHTQAKEFLDLSSHMAANLSSRFRTPIRGKKLKSAMTPLSMAGFTAC